MDYCIVIPVFNHARLLSATVKALDSYDLPIVVVNDGSSTNQSLLIRQLGAQYPFDLVEQEQNRGKGAALKLGLNRAVELGFSHAIQIDADGQHNIGDLKKLMCLSAEHPEQLILATPVFDDSVPKIRLYGRYLTHLFVWINTLSLHVVDSMCGFRVYPLNSTLRLINRQQIGNRMDFDSEIVVRWVWQGLKIQQINSRVIYPKGGSSNFRSVRDNALISWMHCRLFFGMLRRLPLLLMRRFGNG